MAARQDYELFYAREMSLRKIQNYPPYTYLACLEISGKNEDTVIESSYAIVDFLNHSFGEGGQVLGPTTPYIPYHQEMYHRNILVKFKDYDLAHQILEKIIKIYKSKSNIEIAINIDPYNF
jgi:primosomal protein N' (replication factor Y)